MKVDAVDSTARWSRWRPSPWTGMWGAVGVAATGDSLP